MKLILALINVLAVLMVYGNPTKPTETSGSLKKLSAGYYSVANNNPYSINSRSPYYNSNYKPSYTSYSSTASASASSYTSNSLKDLLDKSVARQITICDQIESSLIDVKIFVYHITNLDTEKENIRSASELESAEPSVYTIIEDALEMTQKVKKQVKETRKFIDKIALDLNMKNALNEIQIIVDKFSEGQIYQFELVKLIVCLKKRIIDLNLTSLSSYEKMSDLLDTMVNQAVEIKHDSIKQLEAIFTELLSENTNTYSNSYSYNPQYTIANSDPNTGYDLKKVL